MNGFVVWITGLPSSGKSTFARRVSERLAARGYCPCLLDSDAVRAAMFPALGYDDSAREVFYEALAGLAALLAQQRLGVLVAATAHLRRWRDRARGLAPRYLEVHLTTPASLCAERDRKGLYRAARSHAIAGLPGIGATYEAPLAADVVATGGEDAFALEELLTKLGQNP